MKHQLFSALLVIALGTFMPSCKKSATGIPETPAPIQTAKGKPVGDAVKKMIGPAGGELSSKDGKIKIIVPADAVATSTEFSIQHISNTLYEDPSKLAFRLSPEGATFTKPVSLVFNYGENEYKYSTEDLLTVAYQKADGTWKTLPASLDKTAKTISVKTNHFSDWTVTGEISLSVSHTNLAPGQTAVLRVLGVNHSADDALAPLAPDGWGGTISSVDGWDILQGGGELSDNEPAVGGISASKKYTTPTAISQPITATVKVNIDGNIMIPDSSAAGNKRLFRNMILMVDINIVYIA